jgi:hypothetical protein
MKMMMVKMASRGESGSVFLLIYPSPDQTGREISDEQLKLLIVRK